MFRDELGCLATGVHLEVDESVSPKKLPARGLAIAVAQDAQRELELQIIASTDTILLGLLLG